MSRVLFVTQTHNVWGGMEQWLHHFSAWLATQGWDVQAALPRGRTYNDPDAYLRAHPHLEPIILDVRDGTERTRVEALARAIERSKADLVIPIASGAVFAAIARARAAGARARLLVPIRSLHADLFCNLAEHAGLVDQIVAVSRLIERIITELLPEQRDRIAYVRHGVRPPRYERSAAGDALRVGFVGRLEESTKRVFDLATLAAELSGLPVELHVFGNGPDEQELRRRLEGSRVVLHGARTQDELYETAYPSLDALLLFSPAEGSPNAVYEAMQHGVVPVVARYLGQEEERIVRDGETGLVFPVGDVPAAARAVKSLVADRALWTRLSAAASAEVTTDTDLRMHEDWRRILAATLARPAKPLPARLPEVAAAGGTLDRMLPPSFARGVRRVLGREFVHDDGWGEWPGTAPAPRTCVERVERRLRDSVPSPRDERGEG